MQRYSKLLINTIKIKYKYRGCYLWRYLALDEVALSIISFNTVKVQYLLSLSSSVLD